MEGVAGILESALYYPHSEREAVLRFYTDKLGFRQVASWDNGCAYRVGPGVLLLFDLDLLAGQGGPVSDHGSAPGGHVCLLAGAREYDAVRRRVADAGVEITHDHEWPRGGRSFYFKDPVGNLLEVADSDLWPA